MESPQEFQKKSMEALNRPSAQEKRTAEHFPLWILLDDVRSMHNVGAAFRTADAFNVAGIYLCGYTPRPPHRDIHKTALGATETVLWQYEECITTAIQQLKAKGYKVIAVEQAYNSAFLQQQPFVAGKKIAFIFGNEVTGVSDTALSLCDGCIEIPQWGSKHSLNVSVTIGIVLWEAAKIQLIPTPE